MIAYRSKWKSDGTRDEWLVVDSHHIFRRSVYWDDGELKNGEWRRDTDMCRSDLNQRVSEGILVARRVSIDAEERR